MDYSVFYRFLEGDDDSFNEMLEQLLPLLEQHEKAVGLLRLIANSNGFTSSPYKIPSVLSPCDFSLDENGVKELMTLLGELEARDGTA